jgi:hydroxyacylglutathione hydrolase
MKLTDDVYLVAGGDNGLNMTHAKDSHVYVIDGGDELCLVDAGFGPAQADIEANIRADGLDPAKITTVLLTHYHADHAGGLAGWKRAFGCRVVTGREAAEPIRAGDTHWNGLAWAQSFDFYPREYVLEPCEVDEELDGGEVISIGGMTIDAIYTPGHCKGHFCYLLRGRNRRYLFSGDAVFWGGKIVLQNVVDVSIPDYARSLAALRKIEFEALLPGHLTFSLNNGMRHVVRADTEFRQIGTPRNLLA